MQILALAHNKAEIEAKVHSVIDKFAERGLRSLAVAKQVRSSSDPSASVSACVQSCTYRLCSL